MDKRTLFRSLPVIAALVLSSGRPTLAQQPTDSAAQSSPTAPPKSAPADDAATQASPVSQAHGHAPGFAVHTALSVKLAEAVDSGHLKNGQTVTAHLSSAARLTSGASLPAGTPAKLTVIATVPAGKLNAVGEMSLQLVSVGKTGVYTDILTYRGKPGHKDLPDSAPATGTDAGLPQGAALTFHVQPQPAMASGPPNGTKEGLVNGVSSGDAPPKSTPPDTPPQ
jgi:hypothetical protein